MWVHIVRPLKKWDGLFSDTTCRLTVDGLPQNDLPIISSSDPLAEATSDCANFFAPSAEVSMEMLAIIVGSTGGVIACCAVLGIMVVRHVQHLWLERLGKSRLFHTFSKNAGEKVLAIGYIELVDFFWGSRHVVSEFFGFLGFGVSKCIQEKNAAQRHNYKYIYI